MSFNPSFETLKNIFRQAGATRLVVKQLAENDNSKQQIYLGGDFKVLNDLPYGDVQANSDTKIQTFKAALNFFWLTANGEFEKAPNAKLILYPAYPEVRLSGFLIGCKSSPSKLMQPVPKEKRGPKNAHDGRVLFMAVSSKGNIYAYLGAPGSLASGDFKNYLADQPDIDPAKTTTLHTIGLLEKTAMDSQSKLLAVLAGIRNRGWIETVKMAKDGSIQSYHSPNAGGFTLEALLGIKPNGRSEPDYMGWEVKAHAGDLITLMTPEPNGGFYGERGSDAFIRQYGYERPDRSWYFTGVHKVGILQKKTQLTLVLDGFDAEGEKILDVNGGINLMDSNGCLAASWSFSGLISHWGRKHANAAYVRYEKHKAIAHNVRFLSPIQMGIGTSFTKFLGAMHDGSVIYDPAPKIEAPNSKGVTKVHPRSQFRTSVKKLAPLYDAFNTQQI